MNRDYDKLQMHKNFNAFCDEVMLKFNHNFAGLSLDAVNKLYDDVVFDYIDYPTFEKIEDEDEKESERNDFYPMWSTLWQDSNDYLRRYNSDLLYEKTGIGRITGNDYVDDLIFIKGCGYDFITAHWIPLIVDLLGFVDPLKYFTETELKAVEYET